MNAQEILNEAEKYKINAENCPGFWQLDKSIDFKCV